MNSRVNELFGASKGKRLCIFYVCLFIIVLLFALVLIDTSNICMYV